MDTVRDTSLLKVLILNILCTSQIAWGDTVEIPAMKDNTLYENDAGLLSNGAGRHLFAGRTVQSVGENLRRGLIAFDVAANVPAMATIDSVTLTLNMSRSIAGDASVSLHRVLADWGEGASDAPGQEGAGAPAAPGDATWLHTSFSNAFWASPGGDFDVAASDTLTVGDLGFYTWGSTSQMELDVQQWLDAPLTNYGWLLLGDETSGNLSAKRFDTRESNDPPMLRIDYTVATLECDFSGDGLCDEIDLDLMQGIGPIAPGVPATGNEQFDLDGNGTIDLADRDQWLADAATENGFVSPYKLGDANIDGTVDGQDFLGWNAAKFTSSLLWSDGNFTGDALVDGQDFLVWNSNKFTSSDGVSAVPEPGAGALFVGAMFWLGLARIRFEGRCRREITRRGCNRSADLLNWNDLEFPASNSCLRCRQQSLED